MNDTVFLEKDHIPEFRPKLSSRIKYFFNKISFLLIISFPAVIIYLAHRKHSLFELNQDFWNFDIASGISLVFIGSSIWLQRQELQAQRKELKAQRKATQRHTQETKRLADLTEATAMANIFQQERNVAKTYEEIIINIVFKKETFGVMHHNKRDLFLNNEFMSGNEKLQANWQEWVDNERFDTKEYKKYYEAIMSATTGKHIKDFYESTTFGDIYNMILKKLN